MSNFETPPPGPPRDPVVGSNYEASSGPPFSPPPGGPLDAPAPSFADRVGQAPTPQRTRPWWGFGDVILGGVFVFGIAMVVTVIVFVAVLSSEFDPSSLASGQIDLTNDPKFFAVLGLSALAQQAAQLGWPFLVSSWKGLGVRADWRWKFQVSDISYGVGFALIALAGAALASNVLTWLVGLTDAAAADNTAILTNVRGTPWFWVLLFVVVIGAPVSEEIFFRGLTLRAVEKRLGRYWAVGLSSVIFALPHFIGSGLAGSIVLLGTIFVVGLVLGTAAVVRDGLGTPIIAHMIFNATSVVGALGLLGVI